MTITELFNYIDTYSIGDLNSMDAIYKTIGDCSYPMVFTIISNMELFSFLIIGQENTPLSC